MATISIPKERIERSKGIVILPLAEYQRLLAGSVPSVYLVGKAAAKLDRLVAEGFAEHRARRTKKITSLADLG